MWSKTRWVVASSMLRMNTECRDAIPTRRMSYSRRIIICWATKLVLISSSVILLPQLTVRHGMKLTLTGIHLVGQRQTTLYAILERRENGRHLVTLSTTRNVSSMNVTPRTMLMSSVLLITLRPTTGMWRVMCISTNRRCRLIQVLLMPILKRCICLWPLLLLRTDSYSCWMWSPTSMLIIQTRMVQGWR